MNSIARRIRRLERHYATQLPDPNDRSTETPENAVWISEQIINDLDHFDELDEEARRLLRFVLGDNGFTEERFREFVAWQKEMHHHGQLKRPFGWHGEYQKAMGLDDERSAVLCGDLAIFRRDREVAAQGEVAHDQPVALQGVSQ